MGFLDYLIAFSSIAAVVVSFPAANNCYNASINFNEYEEMTKKAAKISNMAEEQLWKTRNTMAAGGVACVVSLCTAAFMTLNGFLGGAGSIGTGAAVVNIATLMGVNSYVRSYWEGSKRSILPGSKQYNDGLRATEGLMRGLGRMVVAWAVVAVFAGIKALLDSRSA